jgi:hypothetical protein
MYRKIVLVFLSWSALALYAQDIELPDAAEVLCQEFFEKMDAGRFQDTYELVSPLLKARESEVAWHGRMRTERESMGTVGNRRRVSVTTVGDYDGFGSGDYLVAVFQTDFSKYPEVRETLVLASNGDRKPGVVSYRISYNMWPEAALIVRNGLLIVFFIMSLLAAITWAIGKVVKETDGDRSSSKKEEE